MLKNLPRRDFLKALGATASLAGCAAGHQVTLEPGGAQRPAPKRILILGGTGYIGPAIVGAALARGHVVTLYNRGKTNPHLFPTVEKILGERQTDLDKLRGRSWDAVIDTWTRYPSAVRAAAELLRDQVGHYLFVSTISVYKIGREPIDESSAVMTPSEPPPENQDLRNYGPLKVLSEQAAEQAMPGRVTVVRPGVIAGPGDPSDRFTYWPVRLARGGQVLAPGDPGYRMQLIDVRDLGEWIVTAIEARHLGTYNAVGPAEPELRTVLQGCHSGVASTAQFVWVDDKWLEGNDAGSFNDFPLAVGADSPMGGFARVSAARAVARGLRFRPVGVTAKDTLDWWNAQPAERRAKPRPGLTAEREAELLSRWNQRPQPGRSS
ncbi:MAG TPA: NAD-dependent epimerase/dehydratase family protein [Pseudomonadota bacterium]|nr:NAD-dependent epimerase/dehydratase family protein [Pseudomonadota bacterium]